MRHLHFLYTALLCLTLVWACSASPLMAQTPPQEGLCVWLDAGKGVVADAKGAVSRWNDQSPAQNDFTQPNPKALPLLVAGGLAHRPVVQFDGINSAISCVLKKPLTDSATLLVVWQATIPQRQTPQGGMNNRLVETVFDDKGAGHGQFTMAPSPDISPGAGANVTDEPILRCQTGHFPAGSSLAVMCLASQVDRNGQTNSGWNFTGQIAEVMVYSPALSDIEKQAAEAYLMKKYAIH